MKQKKRNCSIDIFRYICALMVVSIHIHPLEQISAQLGYTTYNVIESIAVPFFFAVSGYYFFQKAEKKCIDIKKCIYPLIKIYFIWSIIYSAINFFNWGRYDIINFIKNSIIIFFIYGTYYHLWFIPALIFSIIIVTFIFKFHIQKFMIPISIIFYVIGCLGTSYYNIGIKIPFLNLIFQSNHFTIIRRIFLMGFPFFICGYIIYKTKDIFSNKQSILLFVSSFFIWITEIYIVIKFEFQSNIVISLGLFLLVISILILLLKYPSYGFEKISSPCYAMANFTYFSHPLFIFIIKDVLKLNPGNILLYLCVITITSLIGYIIYKYNNRFLNNLIK